MIGINDLDVTAMMTIFRQFELCSMESSARQLHQLNNQPVSRRCERFSFPMDIGLQSVEGTTLRTSRGAFAR